MKNDSNVPAIDASGNILHFKSPETSYLSNFAPVEVWFGGVRYPSVEHAYTAAKSEDYEWRELCRDPNNSPGKIKRRSRNIKLGKDWETGKFSIMRGLLKQKFQEEPFKTKLLATGARHIQEGNWWGDKVWGVDLRTGKGENRLGKMIMEIRDQLRREASLINL